MSALDRPVTAPLWTDEPAATPGVEVRPSDVLNALDDNHREVLEERLADALVREFGVVAGTSVYERIIADICTASREQEADRG